MRRFEFIVASPHSALRKSIDQTERMVAAVSQPGVSILGHIVNYWPEKKSVEWASGAWDR